MICPKCHKEIPDDSVFCGYCGSKLTKCPKCQKIVLDEYQYCDFCGASIHGDPSSNMSSSNTGYAGYYKPLESVLEEPEEKPVYEKKEKLNIKKIGIALLVLVVVTAGAKYFLSNSSKISLTDTTSSTVTNTNTEITNNANLNLSQGKYIKYNDYYYLCDDTNLYRYNSDLSSSTVLVENVAGYLQIVDNSIYYCDANYHFYKCTLEGKDQTEVIDAAVYYPHIENNKIYYQLDSDNESLYVCDINGKNTKKLNDHQTYDIIKVENTLYYIGSTNIYSYDLDSDKETTLSTVKATSLIYNNNCLYYTLVGDSDSYTLCSYNIETNKTSTLEENAYLLNSTEEYLYYLDLSNKTITTYNISTKDTNSLSIASTNLTILDNECITDVSDVVTLYSLDGSNAQVIFNTSSDDTDTQNKEDNSDDDSNYV